MEIQIFTIHDSKAGAFITPWFSQTVETGQRQFMSAVSDEGTDFHKYPGDYTLFHLGSFNQETCKHDLLTTPQNLGLALVYQRMHVMPAEDRQETLSEAKPFLDIRKEKITSISTS